MVYLTDGMPILKILHAIVALSFWIGLIVWAVKGIDIKTIKDS